MNRRDFIKRILESVGAAVAAPYLPDVIESQSESAFTTSSTATVEVDSVHLATGNVVCGTAFWRATGINLRDFNDPF